MHEKRHAASSKSFVILDGNLIMMCLSPCAHICVYNGSQTRHWILNVTYYAGINFAAMTQCPVASSGIWGNMEFLRVWHSSIMSSFSPFNFPVKRILFLGNLPHSPRELENKHVQFCSALLTTILAPLTKHCFVPTLFPPAILLSGWF